MSGMKRKGPVVDPGLCRCCGTMKKCRVLNVEYEYCGQKEVYTDMFMDCFGVMLSHLDGDVAERLICATCVLRLREALTFKMQVLHCEEALQRRLIDFGSIKSDACDSDDAPLRPMRPREGLPDRHAPARGTRHESGASGEIKPISEQPELIEVKVEPLVALNGELDSEEEKERKGQVQIKVESSGSASAPARRVRKKPRERMHAFWMKQYKPRKGAKHSVKAEYYDSADEEPLERLRLSPGDTPDHLMQSWWMKQHKPKNKPKTSSTLQKSQSISQASQRTEHYLTIEKWPDLIPHS